MPKRLQALVLYCLLTFVALKVVFDLWLMLRFEMRSPLNSDVLIYLTIGRGILHGLHPYTDLFESKPPGVFYLSAASLWMFGGTQLMRSFEVTALLLLPVSLSIAAWLRTKDITLTLVSFIFGGILALWIQEHAAGLQTEMYALLFSTLYILNIRAKTWPRIVLNGFLVLATIAFREPFVLGLLAAALLYSKTIRQFADSFLIPLLIALVAGIVAAYLLGFLGSYVSIYLPAMLFFRIQASPDPLPVRMLWVHHLFSALTVYSTMPLLGYLLGVFWLFAITVKVKLSRWGVILMVLSAILGALGINEYFVLLRLIYVAKNMGIGIAGVLFDKGFAPVLFLYVLGTALYMGLLLYIGIGSRKSLSAILCGLLVLPILSLAIGLGGYPWSYMVFIFPAVILSYLLFVDEANTSIKTIVVLLLCCIVFTYVPSDAKKQGQSLTMYAASQRLSSALDRLMDACRFDKYGFLGSDPVFAFAQHLPVGPLFTPYYHEYLGFSHPLFTQTFQAIDSDANVLIESAAKNADPLPVPLEIRAKFSASTPPCAHGVSLPGYKIFYRN